MVDNNIKFQGLILFGSIKVGTFLRFTAEDCYGSRIIQDVKIHSDYVSVPKCQTICQLQFIFAKLLDENKYEMIDNFGYGTLYGNMFVNVDSIEIKSAKWMKEPNKLLFNIWRPGKYQDVKLIMSKFLN